MGSYIFKLAGVGVLVLVAGIAAMVIFGNIWVRSGIGAAIVIVVGGLLLMAWNVDRKDRVKRAGIDELPRV